MKQVRFPHYLEEKELGSTHYDFIPAKDVKDLSDPISAALSFVFLGDYVVLVEKTDTQWDIVGGKVEGVETWKETCVREAHEEAGVIINSEGIEIIGYFKAVNSKDIKDKTFPRVSYMPVCISFVEKVVFDWERKETLNRGIFSLKKAQAKFIETRKDNGQLLAVLQYVESLIKEKNIDTTFEYVTVDENPAIVDLPITTVQVMGVCKYGNKYCIVRDFDESHFSLPGGGCELGESSVACLKREIQEEAQFKIKSHELLGRVIIHFVSKGKVLSQVAHDRYFCMVDEIGDFLPRKNGFEVEERKFIELKDLQKRVMLLQNSTGDKIILQLKAGLI